MVTSILQTSALHKFLCCRWMVQAVHGKYFSKRKWEYFVTHRPAPGSGVSFAEIEVMLCDIPNRMETLDEQNEAEKERDGKQRKFLL